MVSKTKYGMYRSGLEKKFAEVLPRKFMKYEPFDMPYITHRHYKPDFVYKDWLLVECKGFFREGDTLKYKSIRDCLDEDQEFERKTQHIAPWHHGEGVPPWNPEFPAGLAAPAFQGSFSPASAPIGWKEPLKSCLFTFEVRTRKRAGRGTVTALTHVR